MNIGALRNVIASLIWTLTHQAVKNREHFDDLDLHLPDLAVEHRLVQLAGVLD
jgi:hypothetical protein